MSYAAIELTQFCDQRGAIKVYLEALTEGESSKEIGRLWLEALVAGNAQGTLRRVCWEDEELEVGSVTKTAAKSFLCRAAPRIC